MFRATAPTLLESPFRLAAEETTKRKQSKLATATPSKVTPRRSVGSLRVTLTGRSATTLRKSGLGAWASLGKAHTSLSKQTRQHTAWLSQVQNLLIGTTSKSRFWRTARHLAREPAHPAKNWGNLAKVCSETVARLVKEI